MIAILPLLLLAVPPDISVSPGAAPPLRSQQPVLQRSSPPRAAPVAAPTTPHLASCLVTAQSDPAGAVATATAWRERTRGAERAAAATCLGEALGALGRWDEAEAAFLGARDDVPADAERRARLLAMAGHAALAADARDRALATFDRAAAEAATAGEAALAADLGVDRARVLVALGKTAEAEAALADARAGNPGNADAWLLSATLARRLNRLEEAQAHIERAVQLLPQDPEVGLEAGVIAVLAGRDDAARKSWQSVLAAAPESPAAETARGYLAQLAAPAPAQP